METEEEEANGRKKRRNKTEWNTELKRNERRNTLRCIHTFAFV